ncbi:MAG: hypothetical protein PVG79_04805 [Gemmatimonadales bacterium]|jgi:hypothetical protein
MDCEEFLSGYSDFLDRRFEEHPIVSYCDHLLECANCAEYDRVMRRGLELIRGLEPPEARRADLALRVGERVRGAGPGPGRGVEGSRAARVAAVAALALIAAGSLATLGSRGMAELPPVVVEPSAADELPSLWGPAPKFTPAVNLLRVPDLTDDRFLRLPPQRFSLFRAPLRASGRTSFEGVEAAPE